MRMKTPGRYRFLRREAANAQDRSDTPAGICTNG